MKTLGQIAFDAYNEQRGGVNHLGKPTPAWGDLPEGIRCAWEVATRAVVDGYLGYIRGDHGNDYDPVRGPKRGKPCGAQVQEDGITKRCIAGFEGHQHEHEYPPAPARWTGQHRGREVSTTDGAPPELPVDEASAPKPVGPDGQHRSYWVLSEAERAKGFVRPVRRAYKHTKCGTVTIMGEDLGETYAREPTFYSHTFCVECGDHLPVAEFTWLGTEEVVGS